MAFEWVVAAMDTAPERILFLDDNPDNIAGADEAGLTTMQTCGESEVLAALEDFPEPFQGLKDQPALPASYAIGGIAVQQRQHRVRIRRRQREDDPVESHRGQLPHSVSIRSDAEDAEIRLTCPSGFRPRISDGLNTLHVVHRALGGSPLRVLMNGEPARRSIRRCVATSTSKMRP